MPAPKLIAYIVRADECEAAIGFGLDEESAVGAGATVLGRNVDEIDGFERMKAFDKYAPGPVPVDVLIKKGWWFACDECSTSVSADARDAEDKPLAWSVSGTKVYCSAACCAVRETRAQERLLRAMEALTATRKRWPEAFNLTLPADEGAEAGPVRVQFDFAPNATPATWVVGAATVHVEPKFLEVWKAFSARARARREG